MILALMLQAAAAAASAPSVAPPAPDPFASLKETVVAAIRNCGKSDATGEIRVCSRDRGFAEGEVNRLPKPVRPKPLPSDPPIKLEITGDKPPGGG